VCAKGGTSVSGSERNWILSLDLSLERYLCSVIVMFEFYICMDWI